MIKVGGASYALTCLRCLQQVWHWNCTVYNTCSNLSICSAICLSFLCRLKCFDRSDFPLVFETRVYSISCVSATLMRKVLFLQEITKCTGMDKQISVPYCLLRIPVKSIHWYKPPALHILLNLSLHGIYLIYPSVYLSACLSKSSFFILFSVHVTSYLFAASVHWWVPLSITNIRSNYVGPCIHH